MVVLHFIAAVAAVLVLIYSFQLIAGAGRRRRLPPGPWPLPLVGSFVALAWTRGGQPHRALARLAERHGGLMTIWVGPFPTVVVSTPAAARELLTRRNADLAGRTVLDAWRAEGHATRSVLFLPPGDRWRAMRRFASSELFAQRRLDARQPQRQEKARDLVRHVSLSAARGEPVDVGEAVFVATMDTLSRTLFSVDLGRRGLRGHVKEAVLLAATPTASDVFPAVAASDVLGVRRRMGAHIRAVYQIIDDQFSRRRRGRDAGEARKDDLMDVAIDKEDEEGSQLSYDAIKGLFADLIFAGTDSVSSAVEWAMAELLRHPEAMGKAQEELRAAMGTKTTNKPEVEESDVAQLPYLQAVVKEALRLHPAVPLTFYRAMATAKVGGYTIPKGTNVVLNIWAIHRCADVWAVPDKFMPERFLGKEETMSLWGKNFEFIPFGAGRRVCLGLPLAYRAVHLMLASLLYHFDWTIPEGGIDISEKFGTVVSMATPLKAVAKERDL